MDNSFWTEKIIITGASILACPILYTKLNYPNAPFCWYACIYHKTTLGQVEVKGEEFKGEFIKMVANRKNEKIPEWGWLQQKRKKQDV